MASHFVPWFGTPSSVALLTASRSRLCRLRFVHCLLRATRSAVLSDAAAARHPPGAKRRALNRDRWFVVRQRYADYDEPYDHQEPGQELSQTRGYGASLQRASPSLGACPAFLRSAPHSATSFLVGPERPHS